MYENLLSFLTRVDEFFIEAEAKEERMKKFITEYNEIHDKAISLTSEGIIPLQDDANKRGLELRLYVKDCPQEIINNLRFIKYKRSYKEYYPYRLDNNDIINYLLNEKGYKVGYNFSNHE